MRPGWSKAPAQLALLVLLALARPARASICTVDPADKHTVSTWRVTHERTCWEHVLTPTTYTSLRAAERACAAVLACSGVHDMNCMGNAYMLCDREHALNVSRDGPYDCVHVKPPLGSKTSVDHIGGKWCSKFCCCNVGFHGALCDDFDECTSQPCQNGGACSESAGDPRVNDYYRKYRCKCTSAQFVGHDCGMRPHAANSSLCQLQLGAASAGASTSTIQSYYQFQAGLEVLDTTIKSASTDYERFCVDSYTMHEQGGLCFQRVKMYDKRAKLIGNPLVNCSGRSEVHALMFLCANPCMLDKQSVCCFVPAEVAWMFPCVPIRRHRTRASRRVGPFLRQKSSRCLCMTH